MATSKWRAGAFGAVVAVGGTTLRVDGVKRSAGPTPVWAGERRGAACTKPTWQHDPSCSYRTDSDVSAVANPHEGGAAEYDSNGRRLVPGRWHERIIADKCRHICLAGNASTQVAGKKFWTLSARRRANSNCVSLVSGSNGSCGGSYLCTAGTHQYQTYSGPAGWGTPRGIGAY